MNRGSGTTSRKTLGGYTIVETLIFLAVSTAMFVAVVALVSGQQQKADFTQAVRNFESNMQDIANDVSTGYAAYPFRPGESCKVTGTNTVLIDNSAVGAQQRCIFLGRAIQAVPGGANDQTYQVYTVVGRQRAAGGTEVTSLAEATPVALAPGLGSRASTPDLSQVERLNTAARIGKVTYTQGGVATEIGSFGFFTTFQGYNGASVNSGGLQVDLAPISNSTLSQSSASLVDRIDSHSASTSTITPLNPNGGVTICLISNGSDQHALIRLGGAGTGRLAVSSVINSGSVCP